jgi:hypothetical protein
MVRRTSRRDRGVRGIPGTVADRGAGKHAWVLSRVRAVPTGFATRALMVRGEVTTRV